MYLECEARIVVVENGHFIYRLSALEVLAELYQLPRQLLYLGIPGPRAAIAVEQAVPVLLCAETRCAPSKEEHRLGPMGDGLIGPKANLSDFWRPDHLPPHRSCLLFHNPNRAAQSSHDRRFKARARPPPIWVEAWIVVPCRYVQVLGQGEIVDLTEAEAHHVVGDQLGGGMLADETDLVSLEADVAVRYEAPVVKSETRVWRVRSPVRQLNLVPLAICLAPEGGPPGFVEGAQRPIAAAKPPGECDPACLAVAAPAAFVVHLPANNPRVPAISVRQSRDDSAGCLPES